MVHSSEPSRTRRGPRWILSWIVCSALWAAAATAQSSVAPELRVSARRWAIVVGAGEYEHLGHLDFAENDARAVAEALVTRLGFEEDHVRLLVDHSPDPELTPTAGHILGELEATITDKRAARSDLFVFYFCGHGRAGADGDYLLPTDARKQTVEDLRLPVKRVIGRLVDKGMRNALVIVDACRDGAENSFGRELYDLAGKARLAVILACEPGKQSYEDAKFRHGVFTHFLLEALASDELFDPVSGALWASRVAERTASGVGSWNEGHEPRQHPFRWADLTRDVLLGARLPAGKIGEAMASFLADPHARKQGLEGHIDALGSYAEALYDAGRFSEAVEVLKTAEQLGPVPPETSILLGLAAKELGRSAEAARAFAAVRTAPDCPEALVWLATVHDTSGACSLAERADASLAIWRAQLRSGRVLLMNMLCAVLASTRGEEARAMCASAIGQFPADSREGSFLRAVQAIFEGDWESALAGCERAESIPGDMPDDEFLDGERYEILRLWRGPEAALAFLDQTLERNPDAGRWLTERACLRWKMAGPQGSEEAMLKDVRAALALPLEPGSLLDAVCAAGLHAAEHAPRIREQAAAHPLAWQAQLAVLLAEWTPASLGSRLEEVARLTPRPVKVYVAFSKYLMTSGMSWLDARRSDPSVDRDQARQLELAFLKDLQQVLGELSPFVGDFGDDSEAWAVFGALCGMGGIVEPEARVFERHLGPLLAAGSLPRSLVVQYACACLDTGRWERFRQLQALVPADSLQADSLAWLGAAYCAAFGRDEEALGQLGQRSEPRQRELASTRAPLRALLAARAGRKEEARGLLPDRDPDGLLPLCLSGIAWQVLGDEERVKRVDTELDALGVPASVYQFAWPSFGCAAFWKSQDQRKPRRLLAYAACYFPGNALYRDSSWAREPGLAAFAGLYEFSLKREGALDQAEGSMLTLTVKPSGGVVGSLEFPGGKLIALRGSIDAYGNLECDLPPESGGSTLLAKLAPVSAYADFPSLRRSGQPFQILNKFGLPQMWFGILKE